MRPPGSVLDGLSDDQCRALEMLQRLSANTQRTLGSSLQLQVINNRAPRTPPTDPTAWTRSMPTPIALFSPTLIPTNNKSFAGPVGSRLRHIVSFVSAVIDAASGLGCSILSRSLGATVSAPASIHDATGSGDPRSPPLTGNEHGSGVAQAVDANPGTGFAAAVKKLKERAPAPAWYPVSAESLNNPSSVQTGDIDCISPTECEDRLWLLRGKQLETAYKLVFKLCRAAAGAVGPVKYGKFSAEYLPARVVLVRAGGNKENSGVQNAPTARAPTVTNLLAGLQGDRMKRVRIRSASSVPKECSGAETDLVFKASLCMLMDREPRVQASFHIVCDSLMPPQAFSRPAVGEKRRAAVREQGQT